MSEDGVVTSCEKLIDVSQEIFRAHVPKHSVMQCTTPKGLILALNRMRTILGIEKLNSQALYTTGRRLQVVRRTPSALSGSCAGNAFAAPCYIGASFVLHGLCAALDHALHTSVFHVPGLGSVASEATPSTSTTAAESTSADSCGDGGQPSTAATQSRKRSRWLMSAAARGA